MKLNMISGGVYGTWTRKVLWLNPGLWLPWDKVEKAEMGGTANWSRVSFGDGENVLELMELILVD